MLPWWTLGSLTELPHRGEEGNPCFYFSFQTATVEHKNKLEPDGLCVDTCANVLVWSGGTEDLHQKRFYLFIFPLLKKREGLCQKNKNKKKTTIWKLSYASVSAHFTQSALWNFKMLDRIAFMVVHESGFISFVGVSSLWVSCVVAKKQQQQL